jgi:hypothetical protein
MLESADANKLLGGKISPERGADQQQPRNTLNQKRSRIQSR